MVAFVEWLLAGDAMAAALRQQQVAPLMGATPALRRAGRDRNPMVGGSPPQGLPGQPWP